MKVQQGAFQASKQTWSIYVRNATEIHGVLDHDAFIADHVAYLKADGFIAYFSTNLHENCKMGNELLFI